MPQTARSAHPQPRDEARTDTSTTTVSVRVTRREKRAMEVVAEVHGLEDVGPMLRERSVNDIVREYDELMARVGVVRSA